MNKDPHPPSTKSTSKAYSSNTGPKGVLSDSKLATAEERELRAEALKRTRAEQERRAITGLTVEEEDGLRRREGGERGEYKNQRDERSELDEYWDWGGECGSKEESMIWKRSR